MANEARLRIVIEAEDQAGAYLKGLQGELQQIQKDIDGLSASEDKAGAASDGMGGKVRDAGAAMGEAGDNAAKGAQGFESFAGKLVAIQSGIGIAKEAIAGLKAVWDFAKEGAENQRIADSFQRTASQIGGNANDIVASLDAAARGTVDDEELMQASTRSMTLGVAKSGDELVNIMTLARGASLQFGGDAGTAFETINQAIGNLTPRALKQYGILVSLEDANAAYAASLGVSADALTEEQQRQALLNAVLEQGTKYLGDIGNAATTTSEKMKRMEVSFANLIDGAKELMATGIGTALDIGEAPQKAMDAFTSTAAKMQEEVASGKMSVVDYNNGLAGMAQGLREAGLVIPKVIYDTYTLTDATAAFAKAELDRARGISSTTEAMTWNEVALRRSMAAEAESAQSIVQAQTAAQTHTEVMRSYSNELLYNVEQYQLQKVAAEQAAAAEAIHRASIADSIVANQNLAQSLAGASKAQAEQMLAQGTLDTLKTAYEQGKVPIEDYQKSVDAVMLKYELATPKSIAMSDAQAALNKAFLDGNVPLSDYITAADKIPQIAADGKISMQELAELGIRTATAAAGDQKTVVYDLKTAWEQMPATVKTTYIIDTEGEIPVGASGGRSTISGRQGGGPTGGGGLFMLHPNEWVLSEAQRMGRAPIPGEALPGAAAGSSTSTSNITIHIGSISRDYTPQHVGDEIVNRLRSRGIIA